MSLVERNIAANFTGKAWTFLLGIIFVPIYLSVLGTEAYGFIVFFAALQGAINLLDLGLSPTMTKELARLSADPESAIKQRNLTRTLEIVYWLISALTGLIVVLIAPLLASNWVATQNLSTGALESLIIIMGIATALNFPISLYYGGLMGLQKQVLLNVFDVCVWTIRGIGAVIIITFFYPTVYAFFVWQGLTYLFQTIIVASILWHFLPKVNVPAKFQKNLLLGILPFATGVAASGVLATIISYADKLVLTKLVTLEKYAYYGMATTIGSIALFFVMPIYAAVFPRITQLVANKEQDNLRNFYHNCCQFVSAMVLPITIVIALFSAEIIQVWIRNPTITSETYVVASIAAVSGGINALLWIPMALQLANAWTKLIVTINVIQVILLVPLLVFLTTNYNVVGAASVLLILNLGAFLLSPYYIHKRLLKGELKRWYVRDIGVPFASAFIVAFLWRIALSWQAEFMQPSTFLLFVELAIVFMSTWMVTALIVPITRQYITNYVGTFKNKLSSSL